jgi:lipopolysaccharide export system protein LptA
MFVPGERDLTMVWSGSLTMAPLPAGETPAELAGGNHLTARFDAVTSERVEFSDSEMGASGYGGSIGYFATTRWAELVGGPQSKMVMVSAPSTGRFTAPGVRVNLGTGNATIPGGGVLASFALAAKAKSGAGVDAGGAVASGESLPSDRVRQITWTDQADFKLRTQDGRVVGELEWAQFQGGVEARDRLSVVSGDSLRAEFVRAPEQASSLSRLTVRGKVVAVGGPRSIDPAKAGPSEDPFVTAETLEVSFKPSNAKPGEVDPTFAVASGNVTASGSGARITGQRFEVALERGTGEAVEDVVVAGVTGEGGVRLERASDGVSAKADTLKADGKARTAELTGRNVAVSRGASTILGTQMRLEEGEGRLLVFGAGSFQHEQGEAEGTSGGATRIRATWTKSMAFNNAKGTLEAVGDTEIRALGALSLQTARADRLRLNLTPAAELANAGAGAGAAGAGSEAATLDGRRLLRAEIEGSVLTRDGTARASVESRRYRAPDAEKAKAVGGGRVLEQVLFIEGDRIVADDVRGSLEVPGSGRAVILDQSVEGGSESEDVARGGEVGMPRGTSRFVWDGSLVYVREEGKLSLLGGVELTHKPMGATVAARMTCDRLDARIDAAGQAAAAGQAVRTGGTQLVRADAVGNVLAESGPSRLQADRFEYDARSGRGTAIADDGKRVTLSDDRRGTPYVAKKLAWDIVGDRVEITSPAPLAVPR